MEIGMQPVPVQAYPVQANAVQPASTPSAGVVTAQPIHETSLPPTSCMPGDDSAKANMAWAGVGAGWGCLISRFICLKVLGLAIPCSGVIWCCAWPFAAAVYYYMVPAAQRHHYPRTKTPAMVAIGSCCCLCGCMIFLFICVFAFLSGPEGKAFLCNQVTPEEREDPPWADYCKGIAMGSATKITTNIVARTVNKAAAAVMI